MISTLSIDSKAKHFTNLCNVCISRFKSSSTSVLVLNCGSSSIKFQVVSPDSGEVTLKGQADNLNTDKGKLKWEKDGTKHKENIDQPNFLQTLESVFDIVKSHQFDFVGHRIVHGGELYKKATKISKKMLENLSEINKLAPLHNPIQLSAIQTSLHTFSDKLQAASFDTAYYADMKEHAYLYPVPYNWYTQHKIRRYGFHGLSHDFVYHEVCQKLDLSPKETNVISCHLGAGCSVTASKGGMGVDTSMGFTPLSGVMMGSRSGDVDPTILSYLAKQTNTTSDDVLEDLNKKSGLKGITGSPDSLLSENLYLQGETMGSLAVEMFCYSIAKYIAAFFVPLGRVDCIVFTGGIGEKSAVKRKIILDHLRGLNVHVDNTCNESHGKSNKGRISSEESLIPVYVINTNEELVIARQTQQLFLD